jgi:hypothetical protein
MRGTGKAWARAQMLIVLVAPAVLIAVVAVGVVIVSGTTGGKGTTGARSAAGSGLSRSVSAPAGTRALTGAGAHVTAPPQKAVTRGAKWVAGPAGKLIASVDADLGRISADERAGKNNAARGIGGQLTTDARAAERGPMPPVDAAAYRAALKDFELIGTDTARGDFRAASSLLTAATVGIMTVTAAADSAPPVNSASALNDPS